MKPTKQPDEERRNLITAEVSEIFAAALQVDLISDERAITDFMQAYFSAWSKLNRLQEEHALAFQNSFYGSRYLQKLRTQWQQDREQREAQPAAILSIENHGETAVVITSQAYGCDEDLRRYHLRKTDNRWEIERKGLRCFACKSGCEHDNEICTVCAGVGWCYGRASRDE
ncbi:MAG: hypothetical protein PXX73_05135 [Sideroxydans sp.]|nr:hypothetical protein [Sideroxydans sp.]